MNLRACSKEIQFHAVMKDWLTGNDGWFALLTVRVRFVLTVRVRFVRTEEIGLPLMVRGTLDLVEGESLAFEVG